MRKINTIQLKSYSQYLSAEYCKVNDQYENSSLYWDLNQFINESAIKDLIFKNSKQEFKIEVLNLLRDDILQFIKNEKLNVGILTFEGFTNNNS